MLVERWQAAQISFTLLIVFDRVVKATRIQKLASSTSTVGFFIRYYHPFISR